MFVKRPLINHLFSVCSHESVGEPLPLKGLTPLPTLCRRDPPGLVFLSPIPYHRVATMFCRSVAIQPCLPVACAISHPPTSCHSVTTTDIMSPSRFHRRRVATRSCRLSPAPCRRIATGMRRHEKQAKTVG
ncbi:hypothetical protein LSAT2_004515 [Lamellibrachia satsuma]|nr:hypothetical protein LSAT2_004515 [Lamellibrachia satsuma]